ncbi:MAG: nickel pincer cofactor biosynthesis protein LarC [Desulfobacterota bacterium]|nr:nickel pincer cofactor biosynthesis protein LarC [Thermodesulfobacteriota bacterium]
MKVLVIDPVGGISGDMLLAGLIQLGCPVALLEELYRRLSLGPYTLHVTAETISGIACLQVKFSIPPSDEGRTYAHIRDHVLAGQPEAVRAGAGKIFGVLALAEAQIHGTDVEEVHFHEVGAVDSILDIVGIAAALDHLGVQAVYARTIPLGGGMTGSLHGRLPVPAPATVKLLEGFPVRFAGPDCEIATPTGAAVISALAEKTAPPTDLVIRGVGYGCGTRRFEDWPNICRVMLCEMEGFREQGRIFQVEADIDDMMPEDAAPALERILEAGAADAGITPKVMKYGRPGFTINAICEDARLHAVVNAFLVHTTTIGVRYHAVERQVLQRRQYRLSTRYGEVGIKEVTLPDGSVRCKPENRDLQEVSRRAGIAMATLREEVGRALEEGRKDKEGGR